MSVTLEDPKPTIEGQEEARRVIEAIKNAPAARREGLRPMIKCQVCKQRHREPQCAQNIVKHVAPTMKGIFGAAAFKRVKRVKNAKVSNPVVPANGEVADENRHEDSKILGEAGSGSPSEAGS